jgi:hypothetical protein
MERKLSDKLVEDLFDSGHKKPVSPLVWLFVLKTEPYSFYRGNRGALW